MDQEEEDIVAIERQRKRDNLQIKADSGSMAAMQILDRMDLEDHLKVKKGELMEKAQFTRPENISDLVTDLPVLPSSQNFGEILKDLDISEIENYIRRGEFKSLPAHMTVYLKWLEIAHDWYYKFKDKNWIVNYLMANCRDSEDRCISRYMANKIFGDMLSFFYSDADFKKNSWFMYLAERVMMGAALAWEMNDMKTFTDCQEKAAKILDRITIDKQAVDPRLLNPKPMFFITDAKQLGLPPIDRNALARAIDEMVVPEKVKIRAKRDLGTVARDLSDEDMLGEELKETK
ncbi:MAG TPA: hypothetical protein DCL77_14340 [Prolixibacteraceae bacterium]|jgi:hypothetical protein|nr:hypothetical protein [Prolixibacteraceae bacterium]